MLRRLRAERGDSAHILFTFRVPRVVGCLHAHPNSGTIAEQLAKPNRNARGDRLALAQNVIEMLAGNAEKLRNLSLGLAGRRITSSLSNAPGWVGQRSGLRFAT